jgi:ribosomal protein L17
MRDKQCKQALRREIAAAGTDLKKLRKIAQALIDLAKKGDVAAAIEIGRALDGEAPVQTERRVRC